MIPRYSLILQCLHPEKKTIVLYNHSTAIKIRKWILIQYYHLVIKARSNFSDSSNNFFIVPGSNQGSHVAVSCNVSLVSFNWDQFQWCAAKLDHWEKKKKALVCSGCQFLWCKYSNMAPIWYHCHWTAELGREACNSFSRVSEPMPAVTDYLCLFLYFITTIWFF